MSCGADTTANTLLASLVGDKAFNLPDVDLNGDLFKIPDGTGDLYDGIDKLTNEDLTTRVVGGTGVFDALMDGMSKHLKAEYEANRITGEQYTKAYISGVGGALQTGVSFLLGRDQAYWAAVQAQMQARLVEVQVVLARVNIETAKIQLAEAKMRALIAEAEFGLTKMKIATEDQQFCLMKEQTISAEYNNEKILPAQWDGMELQNAAQTYTNASILPAQLAGMVADTATKTYTNTNILPKQADGLEVDNDTKTYNLTEMLPVQTAGLIAENEIKGVQKTAIESEITLQATQNSKAVYELTYMLPVQLEGIEADTAGKVYTTTQIMPLQLAGLTLDNLAKDYTNENILTKQAAMLAEQVTGVGFDNDGKEYANENILPKQADLLTEQVEVQRAQTLDTRTNGATITGSVGKQKDLYTQQIISYQRDAEVKAAKLFTDAWITQKTLDESLLPPGAFRNDSINVLLRTIKENNNMVDDPGAQPGDPNDP